MPGLLHNQVVGWRIELFDPAVDVFQRNHLAPFLLTNLLLDRLRETFLSDAKSGGPYWHTITDLECYDFTFGERIGWKWDAVLAELKQRGWTPPAAGSPSSRRIAAQSASASRTWTTTGFSTLRAIRIDRRKLSRCTSRGERS